MEYKKIKTTRFNKINNYFPELEYLVSEEKLCLLGGGSLRTLIDKKDNICDIDLFFTDFDNVPKVQSILEENEYNVVFKCPRGELTTLKSGDIKVQLITKRTYKNANDLCYSFDITACCAVWDGEVLTTHEDWFKDVKSKTIAFNDITYPVASIARVIKYYNKGYRYTGQTLTDLVMQINQKEFDGDSLALYVD